MNKGSTIEYIENIYGLASNCLKNNNNLELSKLLTDLELLEDEIRISNDINKLNDLEEIFNALISRIEDIINE